MAGSAGPTIADIINEALGILGVYQGDPLAASDLQSAFFTFQAMVDGWGLEPLTFRQIAVSQFSTTAGKQSYVIGPNAGADWATSFLPLDFGDGSMTMTMGTLELPVNVLTAAQWANIGIKSLQSNIVTDCWPDMGLTSNTLNFWPVPNATIPINLYLPQQFAKPTATSNTFVGAPGYQEALTFELAIKCSSKFGAPVPAWLAQAWQDAKTKLKAANFDFLDATCDPALITNGRRVGGGSLKFYEGR